MFWNLVIFVEKKSYFYFCTAHNVCYLILALERQLSQEKELRVKAERDGVDLNKRATMLDFDLQETRSNLTRTTRLKEKAELEVFYISINLSVYCI